MGSMGVGRAQLDLAVMNGRAEQLDETDIFVWLDRAELPVAINSRLTELWAVTREIAGQVISVGRIIVMHIIDFVRTHPHTAMGMALGAAIGALTSMIPLIGPLLAPLTAAVASFLGLAAGARLDTGCDSAMSAMILVARDFFALLADIFNTLRDALFA